MLMALRTKSMELEKNAIIPPTKEKQEGIPPNPISPQMQTSNIKDGLLRYNHYFIFEGKNTTPTNPIAFGLNQSTTRTYKDIFIVYDCNAIQWMLIRMVAY
eukprot:gnl/Chilomastix_caulleri/2826.p1 GENE.gnl/Chilomastix_caulleri/2826~~gnl/Chilomastix_caulleri/2826.p1  ORF type:complete len:101 (+),score=16.31 gnl/Chilomastix_caulleri/2826:17-319(+)